MLVDIIIPAHNPGHTLEEAIRSCLKQRYKNFNIIVVDDHSSDDIYEMVREFDGVRYFRNESNLGPAASRNVAMQLGKGDLISLLDADDLMHPRKLEVSVAALKSDDSVGMVCGNYRIMVNRKRLLSPFYKKPVSISHGSLMRQNYVASGSVTMRRAVVDDIGGFNEKYWISEDYDMWLRISEKYKIKYIHSILYYYSVVPKGGSLTQRDDIQENHISNIEEIREESRKRIGIKSGIERYKE